jgi:hypothetical protein
VLAKALVSLAIGCVCVMAEAGICALPPHARTGAGADLPEVRTHETTREQPSEPHVLRICEIDARASSNMALSASTSSGRSAPFDIGAAYSVRAGTFGLAITLASRRSNPQYRCMRQPCLTRTALLALSGLL